MKNQLFHTMLGEKTLALLVCAFLSVLPQTSHANDYLEHAEHYTVMSKGNGVFHFVIPVWVYGAYNNYYLESFQDPDNSSGSGLFYSTSADASQGSGTRFVTLSAVREGANKEKQNTKGEGYIYCNQGSIIVTKYDNTTVVLQPGDKSYYYDSNWDNKFETKRKSDDGYDYITYFEFDWYPPTELEGQDFYWYMFVNDYKENGTHYDDYWFSYPQKLTGGTMPQSPELYSPYFYAMDANGPTGYGCAGIQYMTYQDPISYTTTLNANSVSTADRSGTLVVKATDSVLNNFHAQFVVWLDKDAQTRQALLTNDVDIPAYHKLYELAAEQVLDDQKCASNQAKISWRVHNPGAADLVENDMFEIQRALKSDYSDAQTVGMTYMDKTTDIYSYTDDMSDITSDTTDLAMLSSSTDVTVMDANQTTRYATAHVTLSTDSFKVPGRDVYYRVRRGSSSIWGWNHDYAMNASLVKTGHLAPLKQEQDSFQLDKDFETNRKVHFYFDLDNALISYNVPPMDSCKLDYEFSDLSQISMPVWVQLFHDESSSLEESDKNTFEVWMQYRDPDGNTHDQKIAYSHAIPAGTIDVLLMYRTDLPVGSTIIEFYEKYPGESMPFCHLAYGKVIDTAKLIKIQISNSDYDPDATVNLERIWSDEVDQNSQDSVMNTLKALTNVSKQTLYDQLVAQADSYSGTRCTWDNGANLILRRIAEETKDTLEYYVPKDSVIRQRDGGWRAHMTNVADQPCVHYKYSVRIDQSASFLKLEDKKSLQPVDLNGPNLYFNQAADIESFTATQGTDRHCVLLLWKPTPGGVDEYVISRRNSTNSQGNFEPLTTTTETNYRDTSATPGLPYEYQIEVNYTCEGQHSSHVATATGFRSPYGLISGRVHYEDGTGCPGVTVTLTADSLTRSAVTDESGAYVFDSLLYHTATSYTVTPTSQTAQFSYNHSSSGFATVLMTRNNCEVTDLEFDNISSVRFSGRILYSNSTIPVRDANLLLNGIMMRRGSSPVKTDVSGNFTIQVPKNSAFTIQAVKEGHHFEGEGFVRYDGDSILTLDKPNDGVRIYDDTKVRLIGRVTGGRNQAEKPLGFGLSENNLGDDLKLVLELEGDNISQIVHVTDQLDKDTLQSSVPHVLLDSTGHVTDTVGTTAVLFRRKSITITPDPQTGEFCAELFPVPYKIVQATARGYATLFAEGKTSETFDLSDAAKQTDTLTYNSKKVAYNGIYNITYRSPIGISCKQIRYGIEEDYYGELNMPRQNALNQEIVVPLAMKQTDGSYKYLFGAPVFTTQTYQFRISAHEDYYYNNDPAGRHEEVRLHGGTLKVYNGMHDAPTTEVQTTLLNQQGEAMISVPIDYLSFFKTGESALRVLDLSVESDGKFVEKQAVRGYISGNQNKGRDFMAAIDGTPVLLDILRDPPGSGSSAYIESGTSYSYNVTWDVNVKLGIELDGSYGSSSHVVMGTYAGSPAAGLWTGQDMSTSNSYQFSIPITTALYYNSGASFSYTTSERISTSSSDSYVGSMADIYIGTAPNVLYYLTDAVKPIDSLTYAYLAAQLKDSVGNVGTVKKVAEGRDEQGNKYYLVIGEEAGTGVAATGAFAYTQEYILETLLPKLVRERNSLLYTCDTATAHVIADSVRRVIYCTPLAPADTAYGLTNYTRVEPRTTSTSSFKTDEVKRYNDQIRQWITFIIRNEQEKINAFKGQGRDTVGNYSISGGVSQSYSESYQYSSNISLRWDLLVPGFNSGAFNSFMSTATTAASQKVADYLATLAREADQYAKPDTISTVVPGAKIGMKVKPVFDVNIDGTPTNSSSYNKNAGFTLQTNPSGYMNVSVYRLKEPKNKFNVNRDGSVSSTLSYDYDYDASEYLYGSFVYQLNGGASKCPWEGPEESLFYVQNGEPLVLSDGTLKLENPKLDIDVHERSDVPQDKPAIFNLRMTNETEQTLGVGSMSFKLKFVDGSNPKGAKVYIDGMPLTDGRSVSLSPGQVLNKTMEVYAGDGYDFEDLELSLSSTCDGQISSKAKFSVHYMPVSCEVNISAPHDKWVLNTLSPKDSAGWYMPVVIDEYDVNYKNFDHIEFQYKLSKQSDDDWVNLCSYYASDSLYALASGNKAMITSGRIENIRFYGERDPMEQQYDLRAVSFCRHGSGYITRASSVLSGIKDTRPPVLFDQPQPANAILGVGDNLSLRFSEDIAGNYLDEDNNFELLGITNATGITASTSVSFSGKENSYAESKVTRNLASKSFTVDLLVEPVSKDSAEVFFCHGEHGVIFGKTADNRLYATVGNTTVMSRVLNQPITAFTRVLLTYDQTRRKIRFFAGTEEVTDTTVTGMLPSAYSVNGVLTFGRGFNGKMLEARLWTKALEADEIADTHLRYLSGYERYLSAYYRMNEGRGNTLNDKANGATLYLNGTSWNTRKGISLHFNSTDSIRLEGNTLARSDIQDETMMFWFKTSASNGMMFFAESGVNFGIKDGKLLFNDRTVNAQIADNKWHHLVLTVSRTYNNVALYLDDRMLSSFAASQMPGINGVMRLGGGGFVGNIDEFIIYEPALPKTVAEQYDNMTPSGNEMGLYAFLSFEDNQVDSNGMMEQVFSPNDQRVFKNADGTVIDQIVPLIAHDDISKAAQMADKNDCAPISSKGTLTKLNFGWTFDGTELLINLKMLDKEINKQTVYVTVRDVEDLNGNPMVSPVMWSAFVDRNSLRWDERNIYYEVPDNEDFAHTYTTTIRNTTGLTRQFRIEDLPTWLSVDLPSGTLQPLDEKLVTFTVKEGITVGKYSETIYLTDDNDLAEPLTFNLTVSSVCPWDTTDFSGYPNTMNLRGQVVLQAADGVAEIDSDPNDVVAVFYGNEVVGKNNITFDNYANTSYVYLTIYGNSDMAGRLLTFKLWQASTGKVFNLKPDVQQRYQNNGMRGYAPDAPVTLSSSADISQQINLSPGWNWMSLYLRPVSNAIDSVLSEEQGWLTGDPVKIPSERQVAEFNATQWQGSLETIDYHRMYMARPSKDVTVTVDGFRLTDEERTVTLSEGWNGIAYLLNEAQAVQDALADYLDKAQEGDVIKSKTAVAVFSENGRWEGSLQTLRPGQGYLFLRLDTTTVTMTYYPKMSVIGHAPQRDFESSSSDIERTNTRLAAASSTNMTVVAKPGSSIFKLTSVQNDNLRIAAYVGDSLAAIAGPQIVDGDTLFFFTIGSNLTHQVSFRLLYEGRTVGVTKQLFPYKVNDHRGTLRKPVLLDFLKPNEQSGLLPQKVVENGILYILMPDGTVYTGTGKKVN